MDIRENKQIGESVYTEILDNGMRLMIIPKHNTSKKYISWVTKFGSNDNHFIEPETGKEIKVPDGVAHYLEHKMFEQESGEDSLYTMMALGLNANAYTTNDHTAYWFSCTENFYKGLDELMDYVQNPYYTDENVEKERGIIEQEIQMYDDEPVFKMYLNAMRCLYKNNPIRIDTAGTVESISHITKETLYTCYNTFYHPSNMVMCVCGDFKPEDVVVEVKKRLKPREKMEEIKRIYPPHETAINQKRMEHNMNVNMPMFMVGYRDFLDTESDVKKDIAIRIIFNSILGKCSKAYQELYDKGLLMREMDCDFEFSKEYAHVLIDGETQKPDDAYEFITEKLQNEEITQTDFERSRKRLYGEIVTSYDDVERVGRMFATDCIKGINSLDYVDGIKNITLDDAKRIQKEIFKKDQAILSIVN